MQQTYRKDGKVYVELPDELTEAELVRFFANTPYRLMYHKPGVLRLVNRETCPLLEIKA